jgi:hypothetical protein
MELVVGWMANAGHARLDTPDLDRYGLPLSIGKPN